MTPSRPSSAVLTRREDEVARLVAEGLTNREIAERLFISERTAEHHVEQIRNKLGFRSRTQIAGWVAGGARSPSAGGPPGPPPPGTLTVTRRAPTRKRPVMWAALGAAAALAVMGTGTFVAIGRLRSPSVGGPTVITVAGSSKLPEGGGTFGGYSGDFGQARYAQLSGPIAVAVAPSGDIYLADGGNGVIRRIDSGGTITTAAGGGTEAPTPGALATAVDLGFTSAVAVEPDGEVVFANQHAVFVLGLDSRLRVLGDFGQPLGLVVGADSIVYVSDEATDTVWQLGSNGSREAVAGDGRAGYSGDQGSALGAELDQPAGLALDPRRHLLYIADSGNDCVRSVDLRTLVIRTVAGTGAPGYRGDDGPAARAQLDLPVGVAVGPDGALYIADAGNNSIRRVLDGTITTVAGTKRAGFAGDGGPAGSAQFNGPAGIAYAPGLGLIVADAFNDRIRLIRLGPAS